MRKYQLSSKQLSFFHDWVFLKIAPIILLLLCAPVIANGDDLALVTKVTTETADQIVFQISVTNVDFRFTDDKLIRYSVTNNSRKPIYLIAATSERTIKVKDTSVLEIASPIVYPDAHLSFGYSFVEVKPGRSQHGNYTIPAERFSSSDYNFEEAGIRWIFAYLLDLTDLRDCAKADYSLPCLTTVYERAKTVQVGDLRIGNRK